MKTKYFLLPSKTRFEDISDCNAMLARADTLPCGSEGELAITDYFSWEENTQPIAAWLREYNQGDAGKCLWLQADLAHVKPDINGVRMLACGELAVTMDEAEALAEPLRPLLDEWGIKLHLGSPSRWQMQLPETTVLPEFTPASRVLGDDLTAHLPQGETGRKWRQLFTEIQVLLFQNNVNTQREQNGQLSANCLWLWGAGRLPAAVHTPLTTLYADESLATVLAHKATVVHYPVKDWRPDQASAGMLVDLRRAGSAEACWELIRQQVNAQYGYAIICHFTNGERWCLKRRHNFRFWRKQ